MKNIIFLLLGFVLAGCATTKDYDRKLWEYDSVPGVKYSIIDIGNDLYFEDQVLGALLNWKVNNRRRLTNTPDVTESGVDVRAESKLLVYNAGGKWYAQPLGGDDSSREQITAKDLLRLEENN